MPLAVIWGWRHCGSPRFLSVLNIDKAFIKYSSLHAKYLYKRNFKNLQIFQVFLWNLKSLTFFKVLIKKLKQHWMLSIRIIKFVMYDNFFMNPYDIKQHTTGKNKQKLKNYVIIKFLMTIIKNFSKFCNQKT
jgi:hypothetical protein